MKTEGYEFKQLLRMMYAFSDEIHKSQKSMRELSLSVNNMQRKLAAINAVVSSLMEEEHV